MNLHALPDGFVETRDSLHQIAFFALAPARYAAQGRMGLTTAPGGFGTPPFDGRVARVEGDSIVLEESDKVATQTITTVRAAAEFFGIEYEVEWFDGDFHDPLEPTDADTPLPVDDVASRALGQWFNFGFDVLEQFRGHGVEGDDVTEVQLWPEHFDPATEMGDQESGQRASYGASPGDSSHPQPYLYVAPWSEIDPSEPYWSSKSFRGSILGYSQLESVDDPTAAGLDFLLEGYRILHATRQ